MNIVRLGVTKEVFCDEFGSQRGHNVIVLLKLYVQRTVIICFAIVLRLYWI